MSQVQKLSARQAAFVAEYLVDLSATQAAIRAGYSAKTALQQGPRLLGNVCVGAAIAKAQAKRVIEAALESVTEYKTKASTIEKVK